MMDVIGQSLKPALLFMIYPRTTQSKAVGNPNPEYLP
jgi:hypothetical protein